jgi:2-amino-4-hydroxy-6-hydroxymethyldihydropteridine diphosphokinase
VSVRARAVLSVGSNLGDRLGSLQGCVQAIGRLPDTDVLAISPVYQTAPVGGPPQPDYLNAVLLVATAQSPRDLFRATQRIEAGFGRVRAERFGPRTLDVDIISYAGPARDGQLSDDPVLTLPHPRAHERAFVLVPWHDLDPAAELPGRGPIAALLAGLDRSGVHLVPDAVLRLPRPAPPPASAALPGPSRPGPSRPGPSQPGPEPSPPEQPS